MWFRFGELSKVLLIALGAFFPLYLQTFLGLRNVDKKLYDVALILEFSRREQITKLMIKDARSFMQTDVVFVFIIIFTLAGKISDSFVRFLENHLLKWQDSFKA